MMTSILQQYPAFLLIFMRIVSFMVTLPLFSYRTIPNRVKIGISFYLALLITVTIEVPAIELNSLYILLILKEVTLGLFIGLTAYIVISGVQIAGSFIDFQMGFAIASVIDPQTGVQSPVIGQLFYIFALFFLLSTNAHHLLIEGALNSFEFIPIEKQHLFLFEGQVVESLIIAFNKMFIIAFQMAIPIVGSLFLVDVALGILTRTVPQLNVFVVGFPLKIAVSFVMILLLFSALFVVMRDLIQYMIDFTNLMLRLLGE
ncbi:flagellar biosynthetic protein FliR [Bacillus alveayuensis]|uniref:Flagellar biosynthetic protein FliR n=2 Tax=Aeribacillus alveayuensis TaxID=279215 RepID=A0ABT9VLK8_9BACI|nr:flagellar biosynthetic protein FliR [Bacillus alveayuensis]